jgi:translation initiation factor 2B subunit (eIF-2B alpha/beta/delta family)
MLQDIESVYDEVTR